jgi:predicted amidophosphoribosyltransferase
MTGQDGLRVCERCLRTTANRGGICVACLNGAMPVKIRNPERARVKPRKVRQRSRTHSDELIRRVVEVYRKHKMSRCRGVLAAATKELGLPRHTVQHIVSYYSKGYEGQSLPTELPNQSQAS